MESRIQNQSRTIQTHSHVLWNVQFPCHFPSHDRRYLCRSDRKGIHHRLHGRSSKLCTNQRKTRRSNQTGITMMSRQRSILKSQEMEFCKPKIEYLGRVVQEGQISMDPVKLGGIKDWPIPNSVKQIRSFLGFGNFYRKFIKGFSELARPLNDLLKKDVKFEWTIECQSSFDTLKQKFTEEPVLMMPDQSRPFQIECDASKYASGAILTQTDINGDRHPVSFLSKTFSPTERNYEI